jgi:hypothetical protein
MRSFQLERNYATTIWGDEPNNGPFVSDHTDDTSTDVAIILFAYRSLCDCFGRWRAAGVAGRRARGAAACAVATGATIALLGRPRWVVGQQLWRGEPARGRFRGPCIGAHEPCPTSALLHRGYMYMFVRYYAGCHVCGRARGRAVRGDVIR